MEPKTKKGLIAKKKLYDAALSLINEKGYENTTLVAICEKAGIGKGTFYHYFDSKIDILVEYINDESLDLYDFYSKLKQDSYKERLKVFLAYQLDYFNTKGQKTIAVIYASELSDRGKLFNSENFASIKIVTACIKKGQEAGEFIASYSPYFLCTLIWGHLYRATANWCISEEYYDIKKMLLPQIHDLLDIISTTPGNKIF